MAARAPFFPVSATHKFCVDAGTPGLNACFEKKESAFEYARYVSRTMSKKVRVMQLGGLSGSRRKRRRR
jgi:hypothetical protein